MGESGIREGCVGEEEVLPTEETDESVDAETVVGCADAELIMELGLPESIVVAALSTAAYKLSTEFSSRPLANTSTRRPQSAKLTKKTSGSAPPRPVYVRGVELNGLPIGDIS